MKNLKKILSVALVLVMVLTAAPLSGFVGLELPALDWGIKASAKTVASSGWCGPNVTYSYDSVTKELVISGEGPITDFWNTSSPFSNSDIKTVIVEEGITHIGNYTFYQCNELIDVVISDSVISVGDIAFSDCSNLSSVILGAGISYLGSDSFRDCPNFKNITVNSTDFAYGEYNVPFYNSPIETINLSVPTLSECLWLKSVKTINFLDGVETIPDSAFSGMTSLSKVTIADSVTSIGTKAFYGCISLSSVTIPSSVKTIGESAFENCTELDSVVLPEGIEIIEDKAFYNASFLSTINLPKSIIFIGEDILGKTAWYNYRGKGIIIFDDWLFGYKGTPAENTALYLDKDVRGVAFKALQEETNVISIDVAENNPRLSSANGVLYDKNKTKVIVYPHGRDGAYIMPDSVLDILPYTFYNCQKLTHISFSNNIINIADGAFYNCDGLKDINFTNNIKTIGDMAFFDCDYIDELIIPDSVEAIGDYAFANGNWEPDFPSSSLKKVFIGNSVKSIGAYAFDNCNELFDVTFGNNVEIIGESAFGFSNMSKLELPLNLKTIGDRAFYGNKFTVVKIPDSVESIGRYAFFECEYLTDVTIGIGIKFIASDSFGACRNLESIYCGVTQREWNQIDGYNNIPAEVDLYLNHPHEYTYTVVTRPTCTEAGVGRYYCTYGDSYEVAIPATGHTLKIDTANSVPADCINAGYNLYACTVCDYTEKKIVTMGGHVWEQKSYKAPSCDVDGARIKTCIVCGDTTTETVPAVGHVELSILKVSPTCTKAGNELGTKCYICGVILEGCEVIPAIGHTSYNIAAVTPTCTKSGLTAGTKCSVCKEILSGIEYISATGHTEINLDAIEPTCTVKGKTAGKQCTVCNVITSGYKDVPANGHTRVDVAGKDATCLEDGYTSSAYCSVCSTTLKAKTTIEKLGHKEYVYITAVAATCTAEGRTQELRCIRCDIRMSDASAVVSAMGHNIITLAAKAETCTATGLTEGKKCSRCNYVEVAQQTLPALGHDWGATTAVPSTCVEKGYTTKTCQRCNTTDKNTLPLISHNSDSILAYVAPTCTETGKTEGFACSMCGKTMTAQKTIDALDHSMILVDTVDSTCTEKGSKLYVCERKNCSHSYTEPVDMLDHNYVGEWIIDKPETCTEDGSKYRKCTECDATETKVIPATGHKEQYVSYKKETCTTDGVNEGSYCLICGETIYGCDVIPATGHSMTGWFVSVEPGCTTEGLSINSCENCDYYETEIIPAKDHNYPDDWTVLTTATCTSDGVKIKLCNDCLKVLAEAIPKTNHVDKDEDKLCDNCSMNIGQTSVGHTHNWGSWIILKDPTCTAEGGMYRICTACGAAENAYIAARGHSETIAAEIPATCETKGRSEYTYCSVCDTIITSCEEYDALGHDLVFAVTKNATCTEAGINSADCSRCDYGYTTEIPVLAHADNNGDDSCDVCKKTNLSGKPQDPTIICTCNCHKTGIRKLLFKLVLFFQKFLRLNKTCACGVAHY